jgi:hypothetical protein
MPSEGLGGLALILAAGAVIMLTGPAAIAWSSARHQEDFPPTMKVGDTLDAEDAEDADTPSPPAATAGPTVLPALPPATTKAPASPPGAPPSPGRRSRAEGDGRAAAPRAGESTTPVHRLPTATGRVARPSVAAATTPSTLPRTATAPTTTTPTTTTPTTTAVPPATATAAPPGTASVTGTGAQEPPPTTFPSEENTLYGSFETSDPLDVSGWHSGASGRSAIDGSFGTWRGKPVQVIAIWGDTSAREQTEISALREVDGFTGDVDVAVGGLAPGESWAKAAEGAYSDRWRQAARTIAAHRSGSAGTTYVRFAHELNGDWFTWKVNSGNVEAFKSAWRSFHDILAEEYPAAKLVFSPNNGTHSDVTVSDMYPGDDVVDVIGVDFYDGWPAIEDQSDWDEALYATDEGDQPRGVGAWLRFAEAHGKPLSFPEWGLRKGDHPAFIKGMHDFLTANAARPGQVGGKVVYDAYFDIAHERNTGFTLTGSANPQAARMYRSLVWGS